MKAAPPIPRQKSSSAIPSRDAPELLSPTAFLIALAALVAAVFAVYSPALDYQFVLDDHHYLGDPRLQSTGHVWEYFTTYVWAQFTGGPSSFYRPLFLLWFRVNFMLCDMSSWGWHFLSIAKHLAVAILLGLLVWKLLRNRTAVLVAMALFALHPSHTESVAWISVPDPLMAIAILVSLLLYFKFADLSSTNNQPRGKKVPNRDHARVKRWPWLIASSISYFVALLTKETGIVLLPVIFALACAMPRASKNTTFKYRFSNAALVSVPFLALTGVYFLLRRNTLGGFVAATQHLPWRAVLLSWPSILWFYVKVLLWPAKFRAFGNSTLEETFSLNGVVLPTFAISCVAGILGWGLVWAWLKAECDLSERDAIGVRRALIVGTLLLVLPILLTLNLNSLVPGDFLHGRYAYLSSAGLMLLLATGWRLTHKNRKVFLVAAGVVGIAFAIFTVKQEGAWKDDLSVFTEAHEVAPRNAPVALSLARAHVQVALHLGDAGRCEEAVPLFDEVIHNYPQDWYAWAGRGGCLFQLNDLPKAEESLRRAVELSHNPRVTEQWQQVRARLGGGAQ